MTILQNPHDHLYKSTWKLFPSRACSMQAIMPILLPVPKFGLAQIPHGHLTRHNGLYTEHRASYAPPSLPIILLTNSLPFLLPRKSTIFFQKVLQFLSKSFFHTLLIATIECKTMHVWWRPLLLLLLFSFLSEFLHFGGKKVEVQTTQRTF